MIECLGSCLTNKYSEGYPGHRYYGGNEFIDKIETLCQERALKAYNLKDSEWGVNVQPYSGSPANFEVYTALLRPHARIMGLDLPSGGHLTHGYYTFNGKLKTRKAISCSSIYFESIPYGVDKNTGLIDYEKLEELATLYKPDLLIAGYSAYVRELDYSRFRSICDKLGCLLMMDMAHISGLIASGCMESPFQYCDIVTTTTHKTLRGPRAGMIFYRRDERGFEGRINDAVFPCLQGGPHDNVIAGICTQLKEVNTTEFKNYCEQVIKNSKVLADTLKGYGIKLVTDGTDNHIVLVDLRPLELTGNKVEKVCDAANITVNKNTVHGDTNAFSPGGIRIGTPALTTRGFLENDFKKVGEFLNRAIQISLKIQKRVGKALSTFVEEIEKEEDVKTLRTEVREFAKTFKMPGFDITTMKYKE